MLCRTAGRGTCCACAPVTGTRVRAVLGCLRRAGVVSARRREGRRGAAGDHRHRGAAGGKAPWGAREVWGSWRGCPVGRGAPWKSGYERRAGFMAPQTASPLTLAGFVSANSSPIWLAEITRFSSEYRRNKGKQPFVGAEGHFCIISSAFPPQKGSFLALLGPAGPAPRGAQGRADGTAG